MMGIDTERERELEDAIAEAVTLADHRIMDAACGDNNILDYLTASVAMQFLDKVRMSLRAAGLMKIDPTLKERKPQ